MKKIVKFIALVAMFAFGTNAGAQKTVGNVQDFAACKAYLAQHPQDTIESEFSEKVVMDDPGKFAKMGVYVGDTLLRDTIVFVREGKIVRQPRYTKLATREVTRLVYDGEVLAKIDRAAAQTQVAEKLAEGKKRDLYYYQSSVASDTDGKVVKKAADKFGWGIPVEVGYRNGKDIAGITAAIGGSYSFSWGRVELLARFARSRLNDNSENPGEHYNAFGTRLGAHFKVLSLDRFQTWNIYLGGGLGLDWYKTQSKETVEYGLLQSKGSDPYGFAELTVTKRFFATGWEVYAKAGWEQAPSIFQNADTKYTNCVKITLGVNLPLLRHWVRTK